MSTYLLANDGWLSIKVTLQNLSKAVGKVTHKKTTHTFFDRSSLELFKTKTNSYSANAE